MLRLDLLWEKEKSNWDAQEIPQIITDLANQRMQAKQEKNYQLADEIRNQIQSHWYVIKDIPWWFEINKG